VSAVASKQLPPAGTTGVITECPFTRGFILVGTDHFLARTAGEEIDATRHVRVVGHDGDELVVAPLGAEEAAAIEDKLKRQSLPAPTSVSAGPNLFCPNCGSDQLAEAGKSRIDGKMSYVCEACHLELAPVRNRLVLRLLSTVSAVIAVILFAIIAHDRWLGEKKMSPRLFLLPGIFSAIATVGFHDLRKPMPRRW
jgi:predicted RNA-binding Zn-ribbon protein involved in translation (DUF1610 family)